MINPYFAHIIAREEHKIWEQSLTRHGQSEYEYSIRGIVVRRADRRDWLSSETRRVVTSLGTALIVAVHAMATILTARPR